MGGKAYIYIDGKRLEVDATSIEVKYAPEYAQPEIELQGYIRRMEEEGIMRDRFIDEPCDTKACDGYDYGNSLVKKVTDLNLTEDERLLRKFGVVRDDGTLTQTGKDVLLSVVFDEYQDEVIEKLRAVEANETK